MPVCFRDESFVADAANVWRMVNAAPVLAMLQCKQTISLAPCARRSPRWAVGCGKCLENSAALRPTHELHV